MVTTEEQYTASSVDTGNVNYRFFVDMIKNLPGASDMRVLDYGCGQGTIVRMMRDVGIEAYGVESCYEGSSYQALFESDLFKDGSIRVIPESGELPFPDGYFDVIISNQVFEHVVDKTAVMANLKRALKDDGFMQHHFPSREVIKEGHIGIPMSHWFRPGRLRYCYALTLRTLGFGYFRAGSTHREWTRRQLEWIDNFCNYEPYRNLRRLLSEDFEMTHHEIDYCRFRAVSHPMISRILSIRALSGVYERLFRSLGFMVIRLKKRTD